MSYQKLLSFIKYIFNKKKIVKFKSSLEQTELRCPITGDKLQKHNAYRCECGTSYFKEVISSRYIKNCIECNTRFPIELPLLGLSGASSKIGTLNSMSPKEVRDFYNFLLEDNLRKLKYLEESGFISETINKKPK